jgi:hypothetical protein
MKGLTDYITSERWEDVFTIWYVYVDDAYKALERRYGAWRRAGPQPEFSDSEVITIALICDTYFHSDEELCIAFVHSFWLHLFPNLLERSRFNRRRCQLALIIEQVRQYLRGRLIAEADRDRLIDSAPIPACTYGRSKECQTAIGEEHYSVMASRKAKLFGFRAHLLTTLSQVVDEWMLAPAAPHDSKVAAVFLEGANNLRIFGDNAYHDPIIQEELRHDQNITLLAAQRRDAKEPWPKEVRALFNRCRRLIETVLSVLCTVFHLEQVGARSESGRVARLATRFLAYNLSFIVTKQLATLPN